MRSLLARMLFLIGAASVLGSCSVVSSDMLEFSPDGGCRSGAGTYYLPKTHLKVTVQRHTAETTYWHQIAINKIRVPDRHFGYCLDYLTQLTADDIVTVKRYSGTQLLGLVSTDVVDQSGAILRTLVRAVLGGIAGRSRAAVAPKIATVFEADYDPFDIAATAQINDTLRGYGFCLLHEADFADNGARITRYCDSPRTVLAKGPIEPYQLAYRDRLPEERRTLPGLFYRPRIPYNYYLFVRDNPDAKGSAWQLRESAVVEMENIAPVMAARVDRAFFAQRKTTLVFDEGSLKNICVYKSAELEEVSKVVLDVTKSIVALPAQTLQIRIDQVSGQDALARAELALLKTQKSYDDALNGIAHTPFQPTAVTSPFKPGTAAPTIASLTLKRQTVEAAGTELTTLWNGVCPTTVGAPTAAPVNALGGLAP